MAVFDGTPRSHIDTCFWYPHKNVVFGILEGGGRCQTTIPVKKYQYGKNDSSQKREISISVRNTTYHNSTTTVVRNISTVRTVSLPNISTVSDFRKEYQYSEERFQPEMRNIGFQ
jgi:hypothetical protein